MTAQTVTLNPGTGGAQTLFDSITTVDGAAAPAGSPVAQLVKYGFGLQSDFKTVSATQPMPVYGPDVQATGTITATDAVVAAPGGAGAFVSGASTAGSLVAVNCAGGDSAWNVQITGLTSGTLYFEGSLDSTNGTNGNWIAINGRQTGVVNTVLGNNATTNGMFRGNTSGLTWMRVRSVGALAGTPAVIIRISDGTGAVFFNASIPAGSNTIGAITGPAAAALALDSTLTNGNQTSQIRAATLVVTAVGAAAAAVTATLPAAGAGLFHYITRINIVKYATAAITGTATPVTPTSTNLPGSLAWTTPTAQAIGTTYETDVEPTSPIKSSAANTATTIVGPGTASVIWRVTVYYYTGT